MVRVKRAGTMTILPDGTVIYTGFHTVGSCDGDLLEITMRDYMIGRLLAEPPKRVKIHGCVFTEGSTVVE